MNHGQIHHIEYYVNDLERAKSFWGYFLGECLGYEHQSDFKDGFTYIHPTTKSYLTFVKVTDQFQSEKNSRQASGLNHIAFFVGSKEAFESIHRKLKDRGVTILKKDNLDLCFEDSEGICAEVFVQLEIQ